MKVFSGFFLLDSLLCLRYSQSLIHIPIHHRMITATKSLSRHHQNLSSVRPISSNLMLSSSSSSGPAVGGPVGKVHRILCYGDSLTAGTSDSPYDLYPYAPHLERAVNNNADDTTTKYVVRHRGMPGWTADAMVEAGDDPQYGLRSAILGITNPSLSCVIIMAGTNDLGYSMSYPEEEERCNKILKPILALHEMAWENGISQTIAIGIPPSGYQYQVKQAANLANEINTKLQEFCSATSTTTTATPSSSFSSSSNNNNGNNNNKAFYVPFPFQYEQGGKNWTSDGLHFSPQGYQVLGEYLADPLLKILTEEEMES